MPLIPLRFKPGLVRDMTEYSASGSWYDCDKVRFRLGLPEKIGGWVKKIENQFLGTCRCMVSWSLLSGASYLALGTTKKFYVSDGSSYTDVTPLRSDVRLGANPFAVVDTTTTMTVSDTAHGATLGDFVTFSGATTFAGLSSGDLNREFEITEIVDANSYKVVLPNPATSTTSGGGSSVDAAYQINIGINTAFSGLGWGAGTWGHDTWGSDAESGSLIEPRVWTADSFGQDLIACVRNGNIYHWDATLPNDRMTSLADQTGAVDAPIVATATLISAEERHVIVFGCNPLGSVIQDPMFVRWSDSESYVDWLPTETNTAGGYRLSIGTRIVAVQHARSQILIWTDLALYSMTWTGDPYTFSFQQVGYNVSTVGPNSAVTANDTTFWMGESQFFAYDGRINVLPCTVTDYIFTRLNTDQSFKVFAFSNSLYNEVGWFYAVNPTSDDLEPECSAYVTYNYKEQAWYYGELDRTAWIDLGASSYPLATSSDNYLYNHEFGFDDGSTNPPTGIEAYIESSPLEAADNGSGDHFIFMDRLIADVTFRNSSVPRPSVVMTISTQDYPGSLVEQEQASSIKQASSVVDRFTKQSFIRLRGRSAIFRCSSSDVGVTWRLGVPRINYRLDGRR